MSGFPRPRSEPRAPHGGEVADEEHFMTEFDYNAPAELYAAQGRRGFRYRRFFNAGEAIRYAIERLPANLLSGTRLEVEEQDYDGEQIRSLYESEHYPLTRKPSSA